MWIHGRTAPVEFPQPIDQVESFSDVLVVRLRWDNANKRNVYGVDANGVIVWRIADLPLNTNGDIYLSISKMSESVVRAISSLGITFDLDPRSGAVLDSFVSK